MTAPHHACQCACGATRFSVQGPPLLRGFCHCTICQEFNQSAFADISVYRAGDVAMPDSDTLEFRAYRPPPAVQRGRCKACGGPAIEVMQIFPLPRLIIVPSGHLPAACRRDPALHVFYNSRQADVDDDLPKYSGYWKSQLAFGRRLLGALLRGPA